MNLSQQQINRLHLMAAKKTNLSPAELEQRIKSGNVNDLLLNGSANGKSVNEILNDKNALQSLLNNPAARKLLQELTKGK